jgi:glycosyltransferase involved in cell wall biosynthesis
LVVYTGYVYQKKCGDTLRFTSKYTKVIGVIHDLRDIELSLEIDKYLNFRKALSLLPEKKMSSKDIEKEVEKNLELAERYQEMYSQILKNDAVYKIIAVSNYSKEMIEKHIEDDGEKILTYYSPMKNRVTVQPFQFKGNDPKRINYGLMISSDRKEKNAAGAIIAFDRYCTENPDSTIRLMVLGVGGLKDLGIQTVANQNRMIFHKGFIDSNKLEYLYSNALFLVYPSFTEGFGYPPLEAMRYGVPSLVSNRGAVPEICGNAAVYCDPYDIESIQTGFQTIIDLPPSRNKINARYQIITSKQSHDLECLVSLFH